MRTLSPPPREQVATTTSSNVVELADRSPADAPGTALVAVSNVELRVTVRLPPFLPLPVGMLERSGSESLQKVLDTQMKPALAKFRQGYLDWGAGSG